MSEFHFIRPWVLLALIPLGLLTWLIYRRQTGEQAWHGIVAPHLLRHLLSGHTERARCSPLLLIAAGWTVSTVAVAGPTWRREPSPFADDTAALAIVVKVTPSMETEDVQPNRLTRATQKIHDLLELRRGAKTALIAYAGSTHLVMPATTDGGIINAFAEALTPKIMPVDGDQAAAALQAAEHALADSGTGSILWITDGVAPEQAIPLSRWRKTSKVTLRLLPVLAAGRDVEALRQQARAADPDIIPLSADQTDVTAIAHGAKFADTVGETSDRWEESGYWLTPVLAALLLPFFRRGWMAQTAAR